MAQPIHDVVSSDESRGLSDSGAGDLEIQSAPAAQPLTASYAKASLPNEVDDSLMDRTASISDIAPMQRASSRRRCSKGLAIMIMLALACSVAIVLPIISGGKSLDGNALFLTQTEPLVTAWAKLDAIKASLAQEHNLPADSFTLSMNGEGKIKMIYDKSVLTETKLREIGHTIEVGSSSIVDHVRSFEWSSNNGQYVVLFCPPSNIEDSLCNSARPSKGCPPGRTGHDCSECDRKSYGPLCLPCPSCSGSQICMSGKLGTGQCTCPIGRTGAQCNQCAPSYFSASCRPCRSCGSHGTCSDGIGGNGTCSCGAGWTGANCDQCQHVTENGACVACDCGAHGTCMANGACQCRTGWQGRSCDECAEEFYGPNCLPCTTCSSHGTCYDGLNGDGSCICLGGFTGSTCDVAPTIVMNGTTTDPVGIGASQLNSCGQNPVVALTFDDGPHEVRTPIVLQELAALNLRATFFISPANRAVVPTAGQCNVLRSIVSAGHDVKSHSYRHRDMASLSDADIREELSSVADWFRQCLGAAASSIEFDQMRPPFGSATRNLVIIANQMGYTVSTWNVDTLDYLAEGMSAVMTRIENGYVSGNSANILMHDHAYEAGLLERIVAFFRSRSVTRFVTMSECRRLCAPDCRDPSGYNFF